MTVRDLIAALSGFDGDIEVLISTDETPVAAISHCEQEFDHGDDTPFVRIYADADGDAT